MNKILINLILLSTLFVGSIVLLTFDAWADTPTGDVYDIPQDYNNRNYVIQMRSSGTGSKYLPDENGKYTILDYGSYIFDNTYDFTIYYPNDLLCSLYLSVDSYNKNYVGFRFCKSDGDFSFGFDINNFKYDINNVAKIETSYTLNGEKTLVNVYIKKNNCTQHAKYNLNEHGNYEEDLFLSLSGLDRGFYAPSCQLYSINYPFIYYSYSYNVNYGSQYNYNVYSGIYGSSYLVQNFNGSDKLPSAIKCVEKRISTNVTGVFPEPVLNKVNKVSDTTLHCFYDYPTQGRTPNFNYVYPKIYVKEKGKDWAEYQNLVTTGNSVSQIYKLNVDNQNRSIWGSLSLSQLYYRMGYTWTEILSDDFEPPKLEGVIWGVQYGYALTQNILDESSIRKSKIVFSRYVFEDNLVDTPDVGIGDLGDLPNISGSNSSIGIDTGSSGSGSSGGHDINNRPSGGHDVNDNERPTGSGSDVIETPTNGGLSGITDWIKNFKFDFSSIVNAIQGSFSLVTAFASMIGSVFQSFFGEAVGIVAVLAIGICVVLRLVGR